MQRRCVHDEHGRVDPAKAAEPSKPRGSNSGKRPARISDEHQAKRVKSENSMDHYPVFAQQPDIDAMIDPALMGPVDPMLGMQYPDPSMPISDVNTISTPPQHLSAQTSFTTQNGSVQPAIDPNLDPALINQDVLDPSLDPTASTNHQQQELLPSALPQLETAVMGTPDVDKSYSPISAESAGVDAKHESDQDQPAQVQSTTATVVVDGGAADSQANDVANAAPLPVSQAKQEPEVEQRRPSSAATGISPKLEATSPLSHRSSSQTSDTLHQAVAVPSSTDTINVHQNAKPEMSLLDKQETLATSPAGEFTRAGTVVSSTSEADDPSERLAKELQAQEHGLRRRPSVRIS